MVQILLAGGNTKSLDAFLDHVLSVWLLINKNKLSGFHWTTMTALFEMY